MNEFLAFVLVCAATYRLASDISGEYGPLGIYKWLRTTVRSWVEAQVTRDGLELDEHHLYWLHVGIGCAVCLSFFLPFVVTLFGASIIGLGGFFEYVLYSLAAGGAVAGFVNWMEK